MLIKTNKSKQSLNKEESKKEPGVSKVSIKKKSQSPVLFTGGPQT
jgi:hypothetical protein